MKMCWIECRLLFIAFILFSAGCSVGGGGPSSAPADSMTEALQARDLQGVWNSNCQDAKEFGLSARHKLTVADHFFMRETMMNSDGSCQKPMAIIKEEGHFVKGAPGSSGAAPIDFKYEAVQVTPLNELGASTLRLKKFCSVSNWSADQKVDVSAKIGTEHCLPMLKSNHHDIYLTHSSQLFFGTEAGDMTKPENRPKIVDRENRYSR